MEAALASDAARNAFQVRVAGGVEHDGAGEREKVSSCRQEPPHHFIATSLCNRLTRLSDTCLLNHHRRWRLTGTTHHM